MNNNRAVAVVLVGLMLGAMGAGHAATRTGSMCNLLLRAAEVNGLSSAAGSSHIATLPTECRPVRR